MAPFESRKQVGGFTLLEILVVVAILAILTGFAILRLRAGGVDEVLDTEIRRLAALTEAGCEQAIIQARTLGVHFTPEGYDFRMAGDGQWMTMHDRRFRAREFPDVVSVTLDVEGHRVSLTRESETPQVICTSAGELTNFELSMAAGRDSRQLTGLGYGDFRIE